MEKKKYKKGVRKMRKRWWSIQEGCAVQKIEKRGGIGEIELRRFPIPGKLYIHIMWNTGGIDAACNHIFGKDRRSENQEVIEQARKLFGEE